MQKLSRRQVRWVEVLAEYAPNFIYQPGCIHYAPDVLSWIPTLNAVGKPQSLLEAVRQAQNAIMDQEFSGYKSKVSNLTSMFSVNQGLIVELVQDSFPIVIPGDANQLSRISSLSCTLHHFGDTYGVINSLNLYALVFGGRTLPHRYKNSAVHAFLCQQTKVVTLKLLGLF